MTFQGKSAGLADLGREALYALAAPSTPEPVRAEALERAAAVFAKNCRSRVLDEVTRHWLRLSA
jgi:hypothetical protein